jgi:hypothetical protein
MMVCMASLARRHLIYLYLPVYAAKWDAVYREKGCSDKSITGNFDVARVMFDTEDIEKSGYYHKNTP